MLTTNFRTMRSRLFLGRRDCASQIKPKFEATVHGGDGSMSPTLMPLSRLRFSVPHLSQRGPVKWCFAFEEERPDPCAVKLKILYIYMYAKNKKRS